MEAGTDGLLVDKTRPSRIPPLGDAVTERVVALTLTEPPGEVTHWTAAAVGAACGISVSSVHRIWRSHGLRPHQARQFKLSNDPQFAAKVRDIVGLHVNPPEHAVVLSVDEKSQIQPLDRPPAGTAAEGPGKQAIHVVLDNYATHKHPKVIEWLGRHKRFLFHFTPTSASWINAVEGFFAKLINRRLKRG